MSKKYLYHVICPDDFGDYDTYSDFVCCVYSEEEARMTHPDGCNKICENIRDHSWIDYNQINELKVIYLGEADNSIEIGVICASFHAG